MDVYVTRGEVAMLDTLCHGLVIRDGHEDQCCKPPTTAIYDVENVAIWPACTYHAHRYGSGRTMTLAQIREALETGRARLSIKEAP